MKGRALAALLLALTAAAPAAAAGEEEFGAYLTPVPLVVEDWAGPSVWVGNPGDVVISAVVTIEGEGWAPPLTIVEAIEPGERATIPLTAIGEGAARVEAVVTTDAVGMDQARLVLTSEARHLGWWETFPWWLVALVVALFAAALLFVAWRRRRRREEPA